MSELNDYLDAVKKNNPKLAKYWPGAKQEQAMNPNPQPAPGRAVKAMSDVELAFEYRSCKESGECGERLNELEQETTKRVMAQGQPKEEPVATSIKRGCVPCTSQHLVTCVGLLNEAMRFARTDGLGSDQVLDDTNACLAELNSAERVDLRPERIAQLEPWEKELALELLSLSRETRHALEGMRSPDELEKIAANLQPKQREIVKKWYRHKLSNMTPDEKQRLVSEALAKIKNEENP